jgi:fatty acid desaturase
MHRASVPRYFRYRDGILPNLAALSATLVGYPAGILLLVQDNWALKAAGCALVCLSLIWSAYYIHEFAHQTVFRTLEANRRWGTLMTWLNGSCYASFDAMRRKHMRHHVERADVVSFDLQGFLRRAPGWLRNTVLALEWLYVPAVEFVMRGFVIARPFMKQGQAGARLRVLAILAVRTGAFALLGWVSMSALLLYCLAYLLFVTVLRFADCFQHTYEAFPASDDTPLPPEMRRDRVYEQQNTYSDIVGLDNPVLNMLWLNFGFHNAHHDKPAVPWHRLPALHRTLYAGGSAQVITVRELLRSFHIHRVRRVLAPDYGRVLGPDAAGRADGFLGAVGVSFLTAV